MIPPNRILPQKRRLVYNTQLRKKGAYIFRWFVYKRTFCKESAVFAKIDLDTKGAVPYIYNNFIWVAGVKRVYRREEMQWLVQTAGRYMAAAALQIRCSNQSGLFANKGGTTEACLSSLGG